MAILVIQKNVILNCGMWDTPYTLAGFEILALNHTAAAVCEIEVKIKIADEDERIATLRWLYEGKDGEVAMQPKGNGEWKLVSRGVTFFLR